MIKIKIMPLLHEEYEATQIMLLVNDIEKISTLVLTYKELNVSLNGMTCVLDALGIEWELQDTRKNMQWPHMDI